MSAAPTQATTTLGILAGGRASRLAGLDKAWMQRDGVPQVIRWRERFAGDVSAIVVSANRDPARYHRAGLDVVADGLAADIGPLAGLAALAAACRTPWLLTIPVDLLVVADGLLETLAAARADDGAYACDDDGCQPLVALWRVAALAPAALAAIASGDGAVRALQRRLGLAPARFPGLRFGNLNTPDDLAAAGIPSMSESP